jgi:hypothetical protein
MGVCLGLTFDKKLPEGDSFSKFTDGKILVYAMDCLDQICKQKDLTPFSTFAPDYNSLTEELSEGETLDEIWFDTADGLGTVSALIQVTQSEKQWSKGLTKSEIRVVIECLKELERLLRIGKSKKARFCFLYY